MERALAFLAGLLFGGTLAAHAAAQAAAAVTERVVIQISAPEQQIRNQTLSYIENLQELYGSGNVEIEFVALGWGIGVLKFESPPDIAYVPAGLGQIIRRQREGWVDISG